MKTFKDLLIELKACVDSIIWAGDMPIEEVVNKCHRGDWLLWLAAKIDIDKRTLFLAKGKCAETVIHLMKDERSKNAVRAAIEYGNGLINENELKTAADAAYTAYVAPAAAYYAASYAASADAYAASAASADAYDAAVYAADAAASSAYAAATAGASDYTDDVKKKNLQETAEICKGIMGVKIIEKINEILLK